MFTVTAPCPYGVGIKGELSVGTDYLHSLTGDYVCIYRAMVCFWYVLAVRIMQETVIVNHS